MQDPLPRARGLCLQVQGLGDWPQVTGTQAGTDPSARPSWTVWVRILPGLPLTVCAPLAPLENGDPCPHPPQWVRDTSLWGACLRVPCGRLQETQEVPSLALPWAGSPTVPPQGL